MPLAIRKIKNKNLYSVKNIETGKTHAKATSLQKAKRQVKLLNMIDSKKKK
jgi:hypothetical protein